MTIDRRTILRAWVLWVLGAPAGTSPCTQVPWSLGVLSALPRSQMRPHPRSCPRLRCSQLGTHVTTESGPRARPVKPLSGSVQVAVVPRHRWAASPITWADVALGSPHQPRPRLRCSHPGPRAPSGSAKPQGQAGDGKPRRAQGRAEAAGPVPAAGRAHSPQASVRPGSARPPAPRPGACAGPPARPRGQQGRLGRASAAPCPPCLT